MLCRSLCVGLLCICACSIAFAQKPTVRKHREVVVENAVSPQVEQAEAALGKQDLAGAEKLLQSAVTADPKDYRAWFDLGFVFKSTNRTDQAIEAYKHSIELKPTLFESNLELGMLYALAKQAPDAIRYLRAATGLKPQEHATEQIFQTWLALGNLLAPDQLAEAEAALRK